jgi:decaprenyl-phosphate phosphoribosyltransferase
VEYLLLLRPKHWVKNLFLFVPAFFGGTFFDTAYWGRSVMAFVAFSAMASSIYVLNDYRDVEADRAHPKKRKRPLASGSVSPKAALVLMALCCAVSVALCTLLGAKFSVIVGVYFLFNLAYSLGLKHVSILDVLIVASGFVFRIKAGGEVSEVDVSMWLTVMVFLLALFIALAKRRDDVLLQIASGHQIRKASNSYNLEFLNSCITLVSGVTVVAYLMYTVSPHTMERLGTHQLYLTSVFVLAGVFRYLQLTYVNNDSGSPIRLLYSDRFIQVTILLWALSFFLIIYMPEPVKLWLE